MLAGAKEVVGIDINKDALFYAKHHYDADFTFMDVTDMKFKNNYFDVAVSFATIGAVKYWEKFISEMKRVLKPDGIFVMSTGILGKSFLENLRVKKLSYPTLFTKKELITMFKDNFNDVQFYGQGEQVFVFPGRGLINRILRIKNDYTIRPLENSSHNPRVIICVGRVAKMV